MVDLSTSAESLPPPTPQPILVDLDSSQESLPNIDPRPQFQLPVEPLVDLGHINVTQELIPLLQHQTFREACVLLQRLQLPALQPITPPPELPERDQTPPPDPGVDWEGLEAAVATFDGQQYLVLPPHLELQQPEFVPVPQHIPAHFAAPPPMQQVDWATIAHALFVIAERGSGQRHGNPN